jgi:hypothetical protein
MSDVVLEVLKTNLYNLKACVNRLRRSNNLCGKIGLKDLYTDDEFDKFENLTSRYARTTDLLISKVLRSIDAVELIDSGTLIDTANRAAKRGLVDSVSKLRNLKDLRNEISHEYETDDLKNLFKAVLAAVPEILAITDNVIIYCKQYEDG